MKGSSLFSPPPETVVTPQNRRPSWPVTSNTRSFSSRAGLSQAPRPFGQCPVLATSMVWVFAIHLPLTSGAWSAPSTNAGYASNVASARLRMSDQGMHALHMIQLQFLSICFLPIRISYGLHENNELLAAVSWQYYPNISRWKRNSFAVFLYQRPEALAPARGRGARPCRSDERSAGQSSDDPHLLRL